jgi:hypothetical protein
MAIGVLLLSTAPVSDAHAQRTRFNAINACERYGAIQFKRHNPLFYRFVIDRSRVEVDRFADRVGSQFVSTIYRGRAIYETADSVKTVRFICLYAGLGRGPVFVYALD